MLKAIVAFLGIIGMIIGRIFSRKPLPKPASEHLEDPSPTAEAVENAEKKAEDKFGPRPQ